MKITFEEADVKYQLAPPNVHSHNAAERVIRTLKNHLIARLCLCNTRFPTREWDTLIPQA